MTVQDDTRTVHINLVKVNKKVDHCYNFLKLVFKAFCISYHILHGHKVIKSNSISEKMTFASQDLFKKHNNLINVMLIWIYVSLFLLLFLFFCLYCTHYYNTMFWRNLSFGKICTLFIVFYFVGKKILLQNNVGLEKYVNIWGEVKWMIPKVGQKCSC